MKVSEIKVSEIKNLAATNGANLIAYSNNAGDSYAAEARKLRKQGRLVWCETTRKGTHLYEVSK
jgi:hypothetical protein